MLRLHPADLRAIVEAILAAPLMPESPLCPDEVAKGIIADAKLEHPDPKPNARESWRLGNQTTDPAGGMDLKVRRVDEPPVDTFTLNVTDPDTGLVHSMRAPARPWWR